MDALKKLNSALALACIFSFTLSAALIILILVSVRLGDMAPVGPIELIVISTALSFTATFIARTRIKSLLSKVLVGKEVIVSVFLVFLLTIIIIGFFW